MRALPLYPSLYEINTRVWLRRFDTNRRRATLASIPQVVWHDLAEKGMDFIWLMGIWRTSRRCRDQYGFHPDLIEAYGRALPNWQAQDVIGSPYAVDDYELSPDLGQPQDLERLREALHDCGLRLILDFIPNHFSAYSELIERCPEVFLAGNPSLLEKDPTLFYRAEGNDQIFAHGRDPYFPPWADTVQINYCSPAGRDFMVDRLLKVASICDGVRCDMAMLPLNDVFQQTWRPVMDALSLRLPPSEFWTDALSRLRSGFPEFVLVAEAYWGKEWQLQRLGFDFAYDKKLTDLLRFHGAQEIQEHLQATSSGQPRSVHFLENHDEDRALTALGEERSMAGAVVISTLPGMRLYYDGQFEGKRVRLPLQLGREPEDPTQKEIEEFYRQLLAVTQGPVFTSGEWNPLSADSVGDGDGSHGNLLSWLWRYGQEVRVVVVNFSAVEARGFLQIDLGRPDTPSEAIDLLNHQKISIDHQRLRAPGLRIGLSGYQSRILAFSFH